MTVLVDAAVWEWRGAKWAHLVSDESYDELHEFARRIGKRRLGFQGDHYDIEAVDRRRAIDLGAEVLDSRVLVRRLRGAGLRRRNHKPTWQRIGLAERGLVLDPSPLRDLVPRSSDVLTALGYIDQVAHTSAYVDECQLVILFDLQDELVGGIEGADLVWRGEPRADGERSIELFFSR
ncbi:MAG: DUF4031 domain-containing protein [Acidimicrobiales bacterium]|nr:DUF4031 domain-containing protein [Acidimicrobiales bacterium]MDG2216980.1 DUF4031 domain-containing protein [Acidimicrobiales bacterium]